MITRFLQIGVVALWLSMTFWLVRTTWFPDESRFEVVELREVMNAMFENWNETAELVLLENGSEVGRLRISASNARDDDKDLPKEERRHRLSSQGSLSEFGVLEYSERGGGDEEETLSELNSRREKFMWRTVVAVDDQYAFSAVDILLRFPQQPAKLEVNYVKESEDIAIIATVNGIPVVQFEGKLSELQSSIPGDGKGMGIGTGMGIPMPFFSPMPGGAPNTSTGEGGGNEILSSLSQWMLELLSGNASQKTKDKLAAMQPRMTAKFGRTKIAGESMPVYLLLLTVGSETGGGEKSDGTEKAIRLYIGEDGRPVMIDTPFGFEAIAEVLVPDSSSADDDSSEPEVIGRLP